MLYTIKQVKESFLKNIYIYLERSGPQQDLSIWRNPDTLEEIKIGQSEPVEKLKKENTKTELVKDFSALAEKAGEKMSDLYEWFKKLNLGDRLLKVLDGAYKGTKEIAEKAVSVVKEYAGKVMETVKDSFNGRQDLVKDLRENGVKEFSRELKIGANGDDVRALQMVLIKKGYNIGNEIGGFFGSKTKNALIQLQRNELGQNGDGVMDKNGTTMNYCNEVLKKFSQKGKEIAELLEQKSKKSETIMS